MADLIQLRRDTKANWSTANPVLALGEPGCETDTRMWKIGNGSTAWNSLPYFCAEPIVLFTELDNFKDSNLRDNSTPSRYVVVDNETNRRKVGTLDVISDSLNHVVTQIFTTHQTYDDATGTISVNEHRDKKVVCVYRSVKISGGTLPDTNWTRWNYINDEILKGIEGGLEYMSFKDGVFDVSRYNANGDTFAKYETLALALAAIPLKYRDGGMSIKFIQSSDNKYLQYMYNLEYANTTSGNNAFVNVANWEKINIKGEVANSDIQEIKEGINLLLESLANLAFNGEKPTMPWDVPEGDISNYVQDGLVFHLDGIDKGNDLADQWIDLIGGVTFPNHGAIPLDNCWKFNGQGYLGINQQSADLDFSPQTCTIEVVFKSNVASTKDSSLAVHLGKQDSNVLNCIYFVIAQDGWINGVYVDGTGTQNIDGTWTGGHVYAVNPTKVKDNKPHTVSLNKIRAFIDGEQLSSLGVNHWGGNGGGRYIGCCSSYDGGTPTPKYFTKGYAYSVRIYNRILTQEEMFHNQRVDNARFELKLNLPQ